MKPVALLGLVAVALLVGLGVKRAGEREGVLREQIHARELTIAALARQAHAVDTTYVTDTVRLKADHIRYIGLRDTVRLTDTVQVRQLITLADSTIAACSVALETCEHRVAVRDSIIASTNDLLRLERKRRPSFFGMLITKVTWAAIGYGAGRLTK